MVESESLFSWLYVCIQKYTSCVEWSEHDENMYHVHYVLCVVRFWTPVSCALNEWVTRELRKSWSLDILLMQKPSHLVPSWKLFYHLVAERSEYLRIVPWSQCNLPYHLLNSLSACPSCLVPGLDMLLVQYIMGGHAWRPWRHESAAFWSAVKWSLLSIPSAVSVSNLLSLIVIHGVPGW